MGQSVDPQQRKRAGATAWWITGALIVLVAAVVLILRVFFRTDAAGLWSWYSTMPPSEPSRDTLIASASVAVVIWTGALVAFQVKGVSIELRGALLLLEYAFIGPLLALFVSGAVIRTFALIAVLYCCGRAIAHLLIYFRIRRGRSPAVASIGPPMLAFPSFYVGICALGSGAVLYYPTHVTVAYASVGGLIGGLNLVLLTIQRESTR